MSCNSSIHLSFAPTESLTNYDNIAKVLLIGDTGSGKSTFINYLSNYFHQGDLDHLKVAIPCKYHPCPTEVYSHDELNIHDNSQSKTNACTQYIFTDSTTQKQYLFLDTPGLSDTRGTEQSEINMNKIIEAITQLGNLTTVIIVVNGSISRLTTCLRSIIATLNGNLPDVILENVIVVLTNAKKYESPFDLRILNLHGRVYPFYMQNNAFVSDPQTWKKSIHDELQTDWDYSMHQIQLILQTLDSFKQMSINAFLQMQQIRNDIKSTIHQARLELIQIQKIQNELAQLDTDLQLADRDVQAYQDHTRVHTIEKIELVDAPYHSTLCANCNEVCHNNCRLNETTFLGAQIFSECVVMNNGKCQQCPNHCSYIDHYHAKKTIQVTYETLHDLLIDLKKKYDQACESRRNYQEKILTTSETKELLEKTLKQKINQLKGKSNELCRICSTFNLGQELKCLIKQLKLEGELFESLETKTQSEKLVRSLTKFTRLFEENQEKNRRKRPAMHIISRASSVESKPLDTTALKTSDLLELHEKKSDRALLDSILEELYRRVQGKSTGPLSTPNEILIIHKYLDKYKQKSIHDLSYIHRKLQKQINDILKSNIFRISDVNSELLIENFIVQSLLDDKEKSGNIPQESVVLETTAKSLSKSINRSLSTSSYPLPYPVDEAPLLSSGSPSLSSRLIGISHILSAPYPSPDAPSLLPALPYDSPPFPHRKSQSSQPLFRLDDYQTDSIDNESARSSVDYRDSMRMPTPMNNQESFASNFDFFRRKSIESQHTMPSIKRPSKSDIFSVTNDPRNLPSTPRHQLTADLDYEKFRYLDNSQLLSMYADVNVQNHEVRRAAIHQELERRCYGDHPILLVERRNFFDERIKINKKKTIGELLIAQATIKQKIRGYLKNDDVTLINDIPVELIIEGNVLNQLILSKG